jgi:hypothetical protein
MNCRATLCGLLAALGICGCTRKNPDYCGPSYTEDSCTLGPRIDVMTGGGGAGGGGDAGATDASDASDAGPVDTYTGCHSDDDCRMDPGGPACDLQKHVCVACTANKHCSPDAGKGVCDTTGEVCVACLADADCGGITPICHSDHTCQPCGADTECTATSICLDDGSCPAIADVIYAAFPQSGTCTSADGTPSKPYCSAQAALDAASAGSKRIVVLKGNFGNISVTATPALIMVIGQGGAMVDPGANPYGIDVSGLSDLFVRDLLITGAMGTSAVHVSGANATLSLRNVHMTGNTSAGVIAEGGALLTMNRCVVEGKGTSSPAALQTTASAFHITNSVFASSSVGAALDTVPAGREQLFKNNTIVGNALGMSCMGAFATGLLFDKNANIAFSPCAPPACCGAGLDPMLTPDYHLMSGSPCINQLQPDPDVPDDIDGQRRPYGMRSDCGADEYYP